LHSVGVASTTPDILPAQTNYYDYELLLVKQLLRYLRSFTVGTKEYVKKRDMAWISSNILAAVFSTYADFQKFEEVGSVWYGTCIFDSVAAFYPDFNRWEKWTKECELLRNSTSALFCLRMSAYV